jgi:hypothetical protein
MVGMGDMDFWFYLASEHAVAEKSRAMAAQMKTS